MGQISPKFFYPSAPYGASTATNALNAAQPTAQNPQTPLLPPNFTDPGSAMKPGATSPQAPNLGNLGNKMGPQSPLSPYDPRKLFGL